MERVGLRFESPESDLQSTLSCFDAAELSRDVIHPTVAKFNREAVGIYRINLFGSIIVM